MAAPTPVSHVLEPSERLVMVVGNYGSGKTEVAVNLALALADSGRGVQIADLDLVNPYFRSREAAALLRDHGIRVVVPPGAQAFADLPIVLPEIAGMLRPGPGTTTVFDVGGDDVGARALASFRTAIGDAPYQLWQVVNAMRPFTRDVEGCLGVQRAIEASSRLAVTGYVANAHLVTDTTVETVLHGIGLACAVAEKTGAPVRAVAVMEHLADDPRLVACGVPRLVMRRHMLPPWLVRRAADDGAEGPLPAARPVPLGVPGRVTVGRKTPRREPGSPAPDGEAHG